jgi:hypothetical protein
MNIATTKTYGDDKDGDDDNYDEHRSYDNDFKETVLLEPNSLNYSNHYTATVYNGGSSNPINSLSSLPPHPSPSESILRETRKSNVVFIPKISHNINIKTYRPMAMTAKQVRYIDFIF